jgi:dolichol-phosphate mannosyltransferase
MGLPLFSIVVPVYNEIENVERLHAEIKRVMSELEDQWDYELIFTDNHSEDGTYERLVDMAETDHHIRCFRFSRNFGFQRSILSGFRLSRGVAAMQIDCDLQDPPDLIPTFLRLWAAGYKVVYGIRRKRDEFALLSWMRGTFYRMLNRLSEHTIPEQAGDFRLIDRSVIDILCNYDDQTPYIRGFIASLGLEQIGVAYDRPSRRYGHSKFPTWRLTSLAMDAIATHSTAPLRLASLTALVFFLMAALGALMYVVLRVTYDADHWPAGIASIMVMILLNSAMNAIFFGILGEYVGRIFLQVRNRPLSIIENCRDSYAQDGTPPGQQSRTDMRNAIMMVPGAASREQKPPSDQPPMK